MLRGEFQIAEVGDPKRVTVREALQQGSELLSRMGVESARLDAELLLSKVLLARREEIYLNLNMPLRSDAKNLYHSMLQRRAKREPIAYITGQREFWSLDFFVTPDVLVPRPETELLIEIASGLMESPEVSDSKLRILDLGTGSGAIAVSLAKESDHVEVWATDLSHGALKVAEANAARHVVRQKIHFLQGDLFEPVKELEDSFDLIVSNPPYVRQSEMKDLPPDVRDWEPKLALDGGSDGLDLYRRIIGQGHAYLRDGGFMLLEIGASMGNEVSQLFGKIGSYAQIALYPDHAGRNRVVAASKRL